LASTLVIFFTPGRIFRTVSNRLFTDNRAHSLQLRVPGRLRFVVPVLLLADGAAGELAERLWRAVWRVRHQTQAGAHRHALWLHAVSVGEVNICTQLIRALEPRVPNAKIVVSTTTTTGMGELKRKLPSHVSKIYYPVDRWKYVARAQALIKPEAIVLVEAEI
jgi:3-deoxy-D-manno-octulosonic-acid transferase